MSPPLIKRLGKQDVLQIMSEEFFFNIKEDIIEKLELMSNKERLLLLNELETDTGNSVITYDLAEIMENL